MSRGPGNTMRHLEALLTAEWQPLSKLAAGIYATPTPTRAHIEASRRAAKRLADLDRAELRLQHRDVWVPAGQGSQWLWERRFLVARRPLTPEERECEPEEDEREADAAWREQVIAARRNALYR
ncbi:MAG: hypothetical protein ACR2LK_12715 [Solirubrobacteraceae bacterium]